VESKLGLLNGVVERRAIGFFDGLGGECDEAIVFVERERDIAGRGEWEEVALLGVEIARVRRITSRPIGMRNDKAR
jgi:hypothetical protein